MPDKTKDVELTVFATTIKKDGLIDLKAVYDVVRAVAKEGGFSLKDKESVNKPDEGKIEYTWSIDKKLDPYVKVETEIAVLAWKCAEVLVERKGKKVKMHKAETLIKIKAVMKKNYKLNFGKTKFQDFLRRAFEKTLKKPLLERYEKEFVGEMLNLVSRIKKTIEQFD